MATLYWFGVKSLEVAPIPAGPGTTPTWTRIYSIEKASLGASISEQKVYGDNTLQYVYVHTPEAQLNVQLTKFSTEIAALLTGNTVATVSGAEELHIFTSKDLAPPNKMIRVTIDAKEDSTGTPKDLRMIFFKTTVRPIWDGFGGERAKNTDLNWVFDILSSTTNERGDTISGVDFAMGKMIF